MHRTYPPSVTVIMAVRNGLPFLEPAVCSILTQSLHNIEIIVVDDASTDETPVTLARLAAADQRIRIESLTCNEGPALARNRAIALASAPYIAIMDADDIAAPQRLGVQKAYLDNHPQVVLVGTSIRRINGSDKVLGTSRRPRDAVAVRWWARFNMPLTHPTIMFRKFGEGGHFQRYRQGVDSAEDYDFLARALIHGDVVSLPDILLDYRVHGASLTATKWRIQQSYARNISLEVLAHQVPSHIIEALTPFRKAYFDLESPTADMVFNSLRLMLAHDAERFPAYRTWMHRQAAQFASAALKRGGFSKKEIFQAFLGPGRDFATSLGMRYLETQRLLPSLLSSDPKV